MQHEANLTVPVDVEISNAFYAFKHGLLPRSKINDMQLIMRRKRALGFHNGNSTVRFEHRRVLAAGNFNIA